ncbi:MAG: hypothetical protein A2Y17_08960 [Clostridiales bacterium GWF2_38_85]|nr:MAG: hypothetical protein A2Y17_08960 [Clostridiales bacterium GWF2_38_85]HBL83674.1 hypothetical protein [Clostridiales bacterium]
MALQKRGLGRGLDALLTDNTIEETESATGITTIRVYDIEPNRNQPRRSFDQESLEELAASITQHGLIQPIVVRKKSNGFYEIIAGERRWRASKMAGLNEVPVIVKELSDRDAAFLSMVENLQREDLNPVEEAKGYKTLIENYDLTQEEAAVKVGKSRTNVANILRLLKLPDSILSFVENGQLSYGHARTLIPLLSVFSESEIKKQAAYIIDKQLSVRETEALVKNLLTEKPKKIEGNPVRQSYFKELENKVSNNLGRKVKLSNNSLTISYKSSEDLEQLLISICGNEILNNEE